jgi:hypothetical protein
MGGVIPPRLKSPVRQDYAGRSEHALFFNTNRLEFKPRQVGLATAIMSFGLPISETRYLRRRHPEKAQQGSPYQLMGL